MRPEDQSCKRAWRSCPIESYISKIDGREVSGMSWREDRISDLRRDIFAVNVLMLDDKDVKPRVRSLTLTRPAACGISNSTRQ